MTTKVNTSQIADGAITAAKISSSVQLGGPTITAIGYPGDDTAADTAGGQTITLTGTGFKTGASVIINGTTASVVTFVNSTSVTFTAPAQSAGSYVLYLVNTDGGTAIAVPGIQYSGTPTWSTAAGSLATYTETVAISNTVTATGDTPITYSLYSGSLPTGASLNTASGLISGSSPLANNATTYNFTIRATDLQKQDTDRAFSITINPDVVTWSSPANGVTYSVATNSPISNVSLSATAASGQTITYTANSLPTGLTLSGNTVSGTPTVAGSTNTLVTATANNTSKTAVQIINWTVSVAADTYFPYVTTLLSASTPTGNTFVSDASTNSFAITTNGPPRPNNFNPYTSGYYSCYFDGTGDYLTSASNASLGFGTGDFTIEMWIYANSFPGTYNALFDMTQYTTGILCRYQSGTDSLYIAGTAYNWNPTTNFPLNQWNHLALTRASGAVKLFVNGTSVLSVSNSADLGSSNNMRIGDSQHATGYTWPGYVSNFRAIKGSALYTSNFTPPTSPLTAVANTGLLMCQSNRLIDSSSNNLAITKNGDTTISGFIPFTPNTSYSSYGSGYFSGTSDYLSLTSTSNFTSTQNWSVEAWVYPTALTSSNYNQVFCGTGFSFGNYSGTLYITNNSAGILSGGTFVLNAWQHIAVVNTASTSMKLYLNGVLTATGSASSFTMGTTAIGANYNGSQLWNGYIADLRVVNNSASPTYSAAFTPPASPLTAIANTSLLTLQNNQPINNNIFIDNSTNNFIITRAGDATPGTFSPYAGSYSNSFNGSSDYLSLSSAIMALGSNNFTFECWVYFNVLPTSDAWPGSWSSTGVLMGVGSPSLGDGFNFIVGSTQMFVHSNDTKYGTATHGMTTNTWYHVAYVRSGNTIYFYVNGVQKGSVAFSGAIGTGSTTYIGCETGQGAYINGYISNIRLVNGTAVYTTGFTAPTAPLSQVAGTVLLTCQNSRFVDVNAYTPITVSGSPTVQKFNPFSLYTQTTPANTTGYSVNFDNSSYLSISANSAFATGTSDYTIECWVYHIARPSAGGLDAIYDPRTADDTSAPGYQIGSSGNLIWAYSGGVQYTSANTVPLATWTHVAWVRQSNTLYTYINGVKDSNSASMSGNWTGNQPKIGGTNNGTAGAYQFYGLISNFRMTKSAVYTATFTPTTSPLTTTSQGVSSTNVAILACQNSSVIDNSPNVWTITSGAGSPAPNMNNPFGYTSSSSNTYTPSTLGGSMYFDGTGDYLNATGSNLVVGTGMFTLETWVYPTADNTYDGFVSSVYLSSYVGISMSLDKAWIGTSLSLPASFSWRSYITLNAWNHLAMTRDSGGLVRWFVNGVLLSTSTQNVSNINSPSIVVGRRYIDDVYYATGYISDPRLIIGSALYTSSFVPPSAPLTAIKNSNFLLNGTTAGVYDSSTRADFQTVGTAQINTAVKKYGNSSVYFDGSSSYLKAYQGSNFQLGTGDFTIECWSYLTSRAQSYPAIFSNYNSFTGGSLALFAGHGSSTTTQYQVAINGSFPAINAGTIVYNTWVHLAVVRSGSTVTLYVNGSSVGTATSSASLNGVGSVFYVGTTGDSISTGCIQGYLSDFRITKGYARYTGNFTPSTTPFITK
jgi:hypothetical protein